MPLPLLPLLGDCERPVGSLEVLLVPFHAPGPDGRAVTGAPAVRPVFILLTVSPDPVPKMDFDPCPGVGRYQLAVLPAEPLRVQGKPPGRNVESTIVPGTTFVPFRTPVGTVPLAGLDVDDPFLVAIDPTSPLGVVAKPETVDCGGRVGELPVPTPDFIGLPTDSELGLVVFANGPRFERDAGGPMAEPAEPIGLVAVPVCESMPLVVVLANGPVTGPGSLGLFTELVSRPAGDIAPVWFIFVGRPEAETEVGRPTVEFAAVPEDIPDPTPV